MFRVVRFFFCDCLQVMDLKVKGINNCFFMLVFVVVVVLDLVIYIISCISQMFFIGILEPVYMGTLRQ